MMPLPTPPRVKSHESLSANELIAFKDKHGLSDKELSEVLGVTLQAVRLWVRGDRSISVTVSRVIAMFEKYPQLIADF